MAHSFTQINVHMIFSTKDRQPWLDKQMRPRVFAYLAEVARRKGGSVVIANGYSDHAHLLFELAPTVAVADIARDIKANGSRWIRSTFKLRDFAWQEGYTAFSVSRSLRERVWKYIEGQEEHHKMVPFVEELKKWLAQHGKKFDESMLD